MFPSLPSNLDQLVSEGIVNFDPESYIYGKTPRYVGAPEQSLPFERPINSYDPEVPRGKSETQLPSQPQKDEFVSENQKAAIPTWKKLLAGGLVAGLITFVGVKYGGKIASWFSKKPKAPKPPKPPGAPKTKFSAKVGAFFSSIGAWFKKMGSKVSSFFSNIGKKGTATAGTAKGKVAAWFSSAGNWIKNTWSKIPKGVKIGGGIGLGLLALIGIGAAVSNRNKTK